MRPRAFFLSLRALEMKRERTVPAVRGGQATLHELPEAARDAEGHGSALSAHH